jgi:putative transposase
MYSLPWRSVRADSFISTLPSILLAEWTLQQFREFLAFDHPYRFVIHDRDGIFSPVLNQALQTLGVRPLLTPKRAPQANAFCERLIGTIRRECLDYLIPLTEGHLRRILTEFVNHYNRGRPHSSLGPGIPEPIQANLPASQHRHQLPTGYRVASTPVLGGLHHVSPGKGGCLTLGSIFCGAQAFGLEV